MSDIERQEPIATPTVPGVPPMPSAPGASAPPSAMTPNAAWVAPDVTPHQPLAVGGATATGGVDLGAGSGHPVVRVVPPVRLRPMTTAEILDGSYAVIRTRPRTVLVIAAVILMPVQMFSAYASRSGLASLGVFAGQDGMNVMRDASSTTITTVDFILSLVAMLVSSLALFFLGAALTHLVTRWYLGGDPKAGETLKVAFSRSWAILAAWGLLVIAKLAAAITCYLGLIFVVPLFSLTAPVMIAEKLGPIAAAKRSWQLISRRLWRNIGIVALVTLVEYVLQQVLTLLPTALAVALPDPFDWITLGVTTSLVSFVTTSALVAASVLLYMDMRIRTEGLDLEIEAVDAF